MNRSTYSLRRLLALVMALVMFAALFAGCGKKDPEETDPQPSETNQQTVPPTDDVTEEPTAEPTEEPTEPEVTVPPVSMGIVNAGPLNVRAEPNSTADILKRLDINTRVEVLEQKIIDGIKWGRIAEGWINMNYVTLDDADGNNVTDPDQAPVHNDNNIDTGNNGNTGSTGNTGNTGSTGNSGSSDSSTEQLVTNGKTAVLGYGMVSGVTSLNVRYGPGTKYGEVTYITAGQRLAYYQKSGNWARIKSGWVSMTYFDINVSVEGATAKVTAENLNIREEAKSSSKKLGSYKKGDEITIWETSGNWGRTDEGWVSLSYVLFDTDTTSSTGGSTGGTGGTGGSTGGSSGNYTTGTGTVTAYYLNIRQEPSSTGAIIGTYKKGDKVEILEVSGKWGRTVDGWISLVCVQMDLYSTGTGTVTASSLAVRKGPGTSYAQITSVKKDAKVTILEVNGSWGKIEYKTDKFGWINLDYVKMDAPAVKPQVKYTVTIAKTTNGKVTASTLSCVKGTVVTLTAIPSAGYELTSLTAVNTSDNTPVAVSGNKFTMPEGNVNVVAVFEKATSSVYSVTVNTVANGKIVASTTSATAGTEITLTVTPNVGYVLESLTVKDAANNSVPVSGYTFTMPAANVTVAATFKVAKYKVSIAQPEHGSISVNPDTYARGETVSLVVSPELGYTLDKLTVTDAAGKTVYVNSKNQFAMPAGNVTVTATFKLAEYTVTVASAKNGKVVASAKTGVMGDEIELTITPNVGYELDELIVKDAAGNVITVTGDYKFILPAGNVTVTATFKAITV